MGRAAAGAPPVARRGRPGARRHAVPPRQHSANQGAAPKGKTRRGRTASAKIVTDELRELGGHNPPAGARVDSLFLSHAQPEQGPHAPPPESRAPRPNPLDRGAYTAHTMQPCSREDQFRPGGGGGNRPLADQRSPAHGGWITNPPGQPALPGALSDEWL